jgi:hypothetical protein
MTKQILFILFIGIYVQSFSQQVVLNQGYVLPGIVIDGDTLAMVQLQKVYIFPPLKFASHEEYLEYRRLVRDVKKVYPYAQIARKTFMEIQLVLDSLPDGPKRRKYIKAKEDELMNLYSEELKSFTIRQGRILIKLVDRELNQTSYEIIKDFRGGVSAIMWQGVAKLFGETLKSEYDATGEDLLIERVVIMLEQGTL